MIYAGQCTQDQGPILQQGYELKMEICVFFLFAKWLLIFTAHLVHVSMAQLGWYMQNCGSLEYKSYQQALSPDLGRGTHNLLVKMAPGPLTQATRHKQYGTSSGMLCWILDWTCLRSLWGYCVVSGDISTTQKFPQKSNEMNQRYTPQTF